MDKREVTREDYSCSWACAGASGAGVQGLKAEKLEMPLGAGGSPAVRGVLWPE